MVGKKAVGRGALKGLGKKLGVTVTELSDTDSGADDGVAGPSKKKTTLRALKALHPALGWEDFTEGKKLRRELLPEYDKEEEAPQEQLWMPGNIHTI